MIKFFLDDCFNFESKCSFRWRNMKVYFAFTL